MISLTPPFITGKELPLIQQAIEQKYLQGNGNFTELCQNWLEQELGALHVLVTSSCTHSLEIAALVLQLEPGDEIILPSFTFVSTANAFVLRGCRPVFVDIRPDTLNIDECLIERAITRKTKAIVPVHYGGIACEMDAITSIAQRHGLSVIEDNAHGLFGKYNGRFLGTIGEIGAISFHASKNIQCGEGGAFITGSQELLERAHIVRDKGTNRSDFLKRKVDKYSWIGIGSSYLMSELQAAFLFAQLSEHSSIQAKRQILWMHYSDNLRDWALQNNVRIPVVPDACQSSYHLFYLILPSQEYRDTMLYYLRREGIESAFHYVPLHSAPFAKQHGFANPCPITDDVASRLLRIPFHNYLTIDEQDRIIDAIRRFHFQRDLD